ncbi:lysozyme inhibitor LprI family protein [Devosia sp. XJ19-1]|uniref:Lysozyme inhibitor LprI family protein n=1 Tax=Devosia ureilytica TaxID=2952754 RepID=A0A9Q4ARN8_9HYPH|nr:DUF3298 domain-containing protein [Devosia ureilytica]MCP8884806.1 lysozyme inhibitor LprI family protein [Devosia ureilytica]MCP8888437.1 lysozyme inhibitor LprI family protein [Devosia ureilytica]
MIRLIFGAVLFLGGMATASSPALAASFDCTKAGTPFEHAICDTPELSAADDRLARTYATAVGGLSEKALGAIRTSQRDWLGFARRACTRTAEPLSSGRYDARGTSCLVDLFNSRSRALETSRMLNGIRVYPLGRYSARPDPYEADNPESYWPVAQHEMSIVQIDGDDALAAAFNAAVRAEADDLAGVSAEGSEEVSSDDSSDTNYAITLDDVSGNRATLRVETYWYGHGAAHGNYSISFRHYLQAEDRWLEARDIFAGKGWQKKLLELAVEAARIEHGDALWPDDLGDLTEVVTDPERWDLSDAYGLLIQFQPYEISAYAYGAPTARVSWEALAPILAETADKYRYGY